MAKISANYEVVFIMDGRLPEEQVAALTEKFKTLVEQNSTAMEVEEWGKRKLAYAINYITEGYYVLISFTSAPDFPKELDRILGITDGISIARRRCAAAARCSSSSTWTTSSRSTTDMAT